MEPKRLPTWNEFEVEIEELLRSHDIKKKSEKPFIVPEILFRGQSDSSWELKTTMERFTTERIKFNSYYRLICSVLPRVEAFTGNVWNISDYYEYVEEVKNYVPTTVKIEPGLYKYLAYLRHYGFPSPLLDWSMSPYVAAYFAFRELSSCSDEVAIYAYIAHYGVKSGHEAEPFIKQLGSNINPGKRHFLQQCDYTICTELDVTTRTLYYCCHENVFSRSSKRQDILYKFILPASERMEALRKLDRLNINAYSLFGSEEALMETVFLREFYLQNK